LHSSAEGVGEEHDTPGSDDPDGPEALHPAGGPGHLAAVLDWGGLALGDPALDCLLAWTLLSPLTRPTFRAWVGVDEDAWWRGRGWALSIALVALSYYARTNTQITRWARYTIHQVVEDVVNTG